MPVIVVDDNEHIQEFLSVLLQDEGYEVISFDSAVAALAHIKEHALRPRYLITDFNMPMMTGYELHQAICEISGDCKTIVISGRSVKHEIADLPFLHKPFSPDDLLNLIRSL